MPPKFNGTNMKGKNKLFRHDVNNIRLGVGYTVIGKHTIRLLVDRLTAEETKKIADHTQANAESVLHMEVNDLALTYGNREFLSLKRQLEPLSLTTKITLHYHQRIAKLLLQCFADHIECDSYFALMNLVMAFARDIGKLFIPYFDLFSKALMRGLYDKETGGRFIAKTDRLQLTFTALSSLVIGIGGIVSSGLSATAVSSELGYKNEDEDDANATYEQSFMPSLPTNLTEEQQSLVTSIRRVVAIVVQRTFRDTKEYVRRLGAETIAALCRRHARLLPLVMSVCTQAVGIEVRAARVAPKAKKAKAEGEAADAEEASEQDSDASGGEEEDEEAESEASSDDEDEELDEVEKERLAALAKSPILASELKSSAVADSMLYLTQNLLIGIKGALTTNFERTLSAIISALIHQTTGTEETTATLCPQSLHTIATVVIAGTFDAIVTSIRNDQTNTAIPRILSALVEQLLTPAVAHLEAELHYTPTHSADHLQSHVVCARDAVAGEGSVATGFAARYLRVVLATLSAAKHTVLNRAHDSEDTAAAVRSATEGVLTLLRNARAFVKPKAPAPHNLPLLFADALTIAQSLILTDRYSSPQSMKGGEAFVAAILAEAGRMLQGACATNNRTHILTIAHTLRDFCQDISQKSTAHVSRYGQRKDSEGGLTMPCYDEFAVAVFVVLAVKIAGGQLEATFKRELMDTIMVMTEVALSTLPSAGSADLASTSSPNLLNRIIKARVPLPPIQVAGEKKPQPQQPRLVSDVLLSFMKEDLAIFMSEIKTATSNEEHFLHQLERISVWMGLLPSFSMASVSLFEPCVNAIGDYLTAGKKETKVYLSAKLRTRLLQTYVRGSAALSHQTDASEKTAKSAASKLSALIHQIYNAIPAGFHCTSEWAKHPSKPQTESDAESSDMTVSLLLTAFERLRSTSAVDHADGDKSRWIDTCIEPSSYKAFVFVLMHSLATTKSASTRLSTLVLLRDCYDYQHRKSVEDRKAAAANGPSFAIVTSLLRPDQGNVLTQTALAADHTVFDLLIRCEKIDPLTDGLDAKAGVLAPIVFDAASTTNYFDRYGGRSDAFMLQLLVRYFFGVVHVKFSPMWSIAVRIVGNVLRSELNNNSASHDLGLWEHLAQPLLVATVLGNREGHTNHSRTSTFSDDTAPIDATLTVGLYPLAFDDSQLHASGALVSRAFRQISAESVRSRSVHVLTSGQRLSLSDIAFGPNSADGDGHVASASTDGVTVARVLLNTLISIADHIHLVKPSAAASVLSFPEKLVLRLTESDIGATFEASDEAKLGIAAMPSTNNAKAIDQRIEMSILAMSIQFSLTTKALTAAGVSTALIERRKAVIEAALLQYVCSSNSRLQAAAIEGLRKMGVTPYAQYADHLFPICGGKLAIADMGGGNNKNKKTAAGVDNAPKRLSTSNAKSALTFLQSFVMETSIKEEDRVAYITAMLLVCLPVLTATGRAGSGGNAHKKVRDREVLGRKVFALLSRVSGNATNDPLAMVVDVLMERILCLPPADPSDPAVRYDLCMQLAGEGLSIPKLRRRYEQLSKRLLSAMKLLQALVPSVGTRFLEYSHTCFILLLRTYEASMPVNVVRRAGLEGSVRLPTEGGNMIRKLAMSLMKTLLDTYPKQIADFVLVSESRTALATTTLEAIFAHAPLAMGNGQGVQQVGVRGGTTAPLPPPLELAVALSHHVELLPFLIASAEGFLLPSIERYFRQTASDAVVLAVLDIVGRMVGHADERLHAVYLNGKLTATVVRKGFLEPFGEAVFSALHRFVTVTSESVLTEVPTAKKDRTSSNNNPLRVSPKIWKDVILLAAALPEYIRGGNASAETLETNMSHLLEIAINFARSPVCASDRASADMAAETIESIIKQVPKIHPTNHFRRLMHLFNNVTAPIARTVLCSALKVAVNKIEGMNDLATMLQLQAVARCVACMNAFSRSDADDEDAVPTGSKRSRRDEDADEADNGEDKADEDLDAIDFSRYDFEVRYHAFYSLTSFLNKGAPTDKSTTSTAVGKNNKGIAATLKQRKFTGDQDVEIPVTIEQPRLTMEAACLLGLNLLFFIRDRERTIRTFAGESLHALIKYVSHYPIFTAGVDDNAVSEASSSSQLADPLNQFIRPVLLPAFRRGIVSKDSSSRLEHMQGFGYLAQHLPTQFASLAILYSPNAEASFYSCIGSAQHRVRMNALGLLRKKCGQMHQREVLRVFVPFVVTYLKDYAQGKQDSRTEQISEAKQKGFADSLLMTLAAISAHMPWEGYHRILSLLLREAKDHEALRAVMLKGIVRVLESFHFLEVDEMTGEKRILDKVAPWAGGDDEAEGEDNAVAGPNLDENDASAELATSALAPSARAERKNIRIMAILEDEVLPQLYGFILAQKKGSKSKDLEGTLHESAKGANNQDRKNEPKASVQLPVAVGILKIIRLFPQNRFDYHVDILLNEIVLKLRTKNDKQRETARNVLFAMMNEAGPAKLRFVVTKLRDNLVHGYQLHVLGFTLVGLLQSMFGYAGEKATVVAAAEPTSAEEEEPSAEAEGEGEGDDDSSDDENDEQEKVTKQEDEEQLATTDGTKAPAKKAAAPPKPIMAHTPADEKRIIGKAFRMGGTRRRIFSTAESTAALDAVMSDLFDIFVDDYLGEVGEQKEQTELISTLREVKHNKSLQGFSFLAMYCSGDKVMDMFVTKIRWVLAPPSALELVKNMTNTSVMGTNSKYINGGKRRSADARFVERVRVLAVRVAKSLILNETLSLGAALSASLTMLNRNNTLREAKIAEFEAKDGTRRIRGNIDQFTAAKRLTLKEQRDKNYVVEERPDRIDFDFSSHTVLATQHKQKLRVYKGTYAKAMKETSKSFRNEDSESAVVLDTLDEFNLKFLLLLLKKALGIGRLKAAPKKTKIVTEAPAEGEEGAEGGEPAPLTAEADAEDEEDTMEAAPLEEGYDEMELFERQQRHDDDLGEGRAVKRNDKAAKAAKAERSLAELFGDEHKGQLTELLVPVLAILQGEGADSVITTGFEVTHALLAINPPLPAVKTSGQVLFDVIADLFDRGGDVKPRAMRVMAALVQHAFFTLSNDQAVWLTKVARGELIERTKFLTMGLGLLQAVVNKHVEIAEVYGLIDSVTELMMHKASSPPVRNRCVSIIAKFITEYRITLQKLQSHINMYVQNLQYPNVDGRLAMLELIGVLVFRLPQQVLREEANVLFIPLVHCMSESPWSSCQEKAAVVIQSLVLNAGVDLVAKTISVWLQSDVMKTREYAMQVLAVILPVIPQLYGVDATEEGVAADAEAKAERFATVKAATEWVISELQQAIVYDHPLSKNKQQQIKDEIQKELSAKTSKKAGKDVKDVALAVSKRIRAEKEMASWSFSFFSLRAVEALSLVSPSFCTYFAEGENSVIMSHLAKELVTHSHPWVRSSATRIFNNFVGGYVFANTPYADTTLRWKLASTPAQEDSPFYLGLACSTHNGVVTVTSSREQVLAVQEDAKRAAKQLLVAIANSDVRDELHYGYKAIDDPFRTVLVDIVSRLARILSVTTVLLAPASSEDIAVSAIQSFWKQLQSMLEPILTGKSVRGYLVRSATVAQLVARLIKDLPFSAQFAVRSTPIVHAVVGIPLLESVIVPFVGICAESAEISHRVAEFGMATIDVLKSCVGTHGAEFDGTVSAESDEARVIAKKMKKRRAEGASGGILATAHAEASAQQSAHSAVVMALAKITDEIKDKQRKAKIAEMHEKNFKKAQRQEERAEKIQAMNQKRTGGKRRSRYAQ